MSNNLWFSHRVLRLELDGIIDSHILNFINQHKKTFIIILIILFFYLNIIFVCI